MFDVEEIIEIVPTRSVSLYILFSLYKHDLFKHKNRVIEKMPPLLKIVSFKFYKKVLFIKKVWNSHNGKINYEDLIFY